MHQKHKGGGNEKMPRKSSQNEAGGGDVKRLGTRPLEEIMRINDKNHEILAEGIGKKEKTVALMA